METARGKTAKLKYSSHMAITLSCQTEAAMTHHLYCYMNLAPGPARVYLAYLAVSLLKRAYLSARALPPNGRVQARAFEKQFCFYPRLVSPLDTCGLHRLLEPSSLERVAHTPRLSHPTCAIFARRVSAVNTLGSSSKAACTSDTVSAMLSKGRLWRTGT